MWYFSWMLGLGLAATAEAALARSGREVAPITRIAHRLAMRDPYRVRGAAPVVPSIARSMLCTRESCPRRLLSFIMSPRPLRRANSTVMSAMAPAIVGHPVVATITGTRSFQENFYRSATTNQKAGSDSEHVLGSSGKRA